MLTHEQPHLTFIGAGGVGTAAADIYSEHFPEVALHIADYRLPAAEAAVAGRPGWDSHELDVTDSEALADFLNSTPSRVIVNCLDPIYNPAVFKAVYRAGRDYVDMAMTPSIVTDGPNGKVQTRQHLGHDQLAQDKAWAESGQRAVLGAGINPGMTGVFARLLRDNYFDWGTMKKVAVVDGADYAVEGCNFPVYFNARVFVEECLRRGVRGLKNGRRVTNPPLSKVARVHLPEGLGLTDLTEVEHEEAVTMCRTLGVDVRFYYSLDEKTRETLRELGQLSPRELDAQLALLPPPASYAPRMRGGECVGVLATGNIRGERGHVYMYHHVDAQEVWAREKRQAVLHQTACGMVAISSTLIDGGGGNRPGVMATEELNPDPIYEQFQRIAGSVKIIEMPSNVF